MERNTPNVLLIPLLAVLALFFPLMNMLPTLTSQTPGASSTGPNQPELTPSPSTDTGSLPDSGIAVNLLCDFFSSEPPPPVPGSAPKTRGRSGDYCHISEKLAGYTLETLIATVPDPRDSRLDYFFDRSLEAIQRAVADAGYLFDRHSLPWSFRKPTGDEAKVAPRYRTDPGVILFRRGIQDKKLLLVFLVGETPTAGIHKPAFQNALKQIEGLPGRNEKKDEIRVMGPTFSGSAVSLALALKNWLQEHNQAKVTIISGSATAITKSDFLNLTGAPTRVILHATVIPDSEAENKFKEYLKKDLNAIDNDSMTSQMAILSESNTSYGRGDQSNTSYGRGDQGQRILQLYFPIHISQVRSASARINPSRTERSQNQLNNDHRGQWFVSINTECIVEKPAEIFVSDCTVVDLGESRSASLRIIECARDVENQTLEEHS